MVDEEDEKEGLVDEQEDLSRVLDYYEKKFKAKIGIMPAVVETDEIEMDLIVDMDSDQVLGMRLFQFLPVEGEGDEGEEDGEEASKDASKETKDAGDEEDEEIDDEIYDVLVYDFTRSDDPKAKVPGESILEVEVGAPECEEDADEEEKAPQKPTAAKKPIKEVASPAPDEEKFWVHIAVFMQEDAEGAELSGAVLHYINKPQVKIAFLPNPDLN